MAFKRCAVCLQPYRTGGGVVLAYQDDERVRAVRACLACANKAVRVVVGATASKCSCGARATTCTACATKAAQTHAAEAAGLPAAIRRLEGLVKARRSGGTAPAPATADARDIRLMLAGTVEGLEIAIDLLKSGRFE